MNEKNNFSNVQRLNSTIMAKYEWASSLINMQKSGEEIHERRTKNHRKANKFLEELLQKRSDGSLLDDNGIIDRYNKFLKYKTNLNNDDNILDEFDRRLRSLNNNNRRNQLSKIFKSNIKESITIGLQTTHPYENHTIQQLNIKDRNKSLSTLNNTYSTISSNISSEESQTNIIINTDEQSSISSLNNSITNILYKPKARRIDGSEIIVLTAEKPLEQISSKITMFNYCFFPRSLKSRKQIDTNIISKNNISSSSSSPIEQQYDNKEIFHLLDQIENQCDLKNFTTILDQLNLSIIQTYETIDNNNNNISLINNEENENKEKNFFTSNLFDQSLLSHNYYTIFTTNINDSNKIFLYTMTISTVQLTPSHLIPYSILNGRRPLLQSSIQTDFKQIRSKRQKYTCQVPAIDSLINMQNLQQNDIILKINNQSVWHLSIDIIKDILQQHSKQSSNCSLTIARLSQPFI